MLIERLVLGTARVTGGASAREGHDLVPAALDGGVRHVDTAPSYGMGTAETVVGEALRRFGGEVSVTTKLGSRRDPLAYPKTWLRRIKRLVAPPAPAGDDPRDYRLPEPLTVPTGNDFSAGAMRESLRRSLDALGRIDRLLLHDVTAAQYDTGLAAALAGLGAEAGAQVGYATRTLFDPALDAHFAPLAVGQCMPLPAWLSASPPPLPDRPLALHSLVHLMDHLRHGDTAFSGALDAAAARLPGDGAAARLACFYAWTAARLPDARLIYATTRRDRLDGFLRAVHAIDREGPVREWASRLAL